MKLNERIFQQTLANLQCIGLSESETQPTMTDFKLLSIIHC
ncbi:hypothetical protein [Anabaena sp. FACHB-1237]|nr:hypothetical protein [Anabaena sp. FACHB-1237]